MRACIHCCSETPRTAHTLHAPHTQRHSDATTQGLVEAPGRRRELAESTPSLVLHLIAKRFRLLLLPVLVFRVSGECVRACSRQLARVLAGRRAGELTCCVRRLDALCSSAVTIW